MKVEWGVHRAVNKNDSITVVWKNSVVTVTSLPQTLANSRWGVKLVALSDTQCNSVAVRIYDHLEVMGTVFHTIGHILPTVSPSCSLPKTLRPENPFQKSSIPCQFLLNSLSCLSGCCGKWPLYIGRLFLICPLLLPYNGWSPWELTDDVSETAPCIFLLQA